MMTDEMLSTRLIRYAEEYSVDVWGEKVAPMPTVADLDRMALRIDGWANAHVESECPCGRTPETCGEFNAAAEWVESR